jgi:glucosamine 6-phosphate synthetase-like amidotransferase/phosphosugar isomerase protein
MCSIAGYSLSENSKIQPRKLAKALLREMDVRGNQASGYAWQSSTGSGIFKRDVAGASLSMKPMSRGTRVAVLHTRYATHGSIKNNANNHPVLSPDKSVALVHNGVIYNHDLVRGEIPFKLPEVDSSVIPGLLQTFQRDTNSFDKLDGDASVAWLDDNDRLTLKVARISYSPLCIAMLADGSFVFASTEEMLLIALESIGINPIYTEVISEKTLLTVENGSLVNIETLPEIDPKYVQKMSYNYSGFRTMTAGGHSTKVSGYGQAWDNEWYDQMPNVGQPSDYYGEDLTGYYSDESEPALGTLNDPELYGFPRVGDYYCNEYGEYFDEYGSFMGSVDDFAEMGYLSNSQVDEFTKAWWSIHSSKM